jgi:MOSC domain-containing protein YiiM
MPNSTAKIVALSISTTRGGPKQNIPHAEVIAGYGIKGDGHAGDWHRQISLLPKEEIDKLHDRGLNLKPGQLAENITTQGLNFKQLELGSRLALGADVLLEVTQIGKVCHNPCAIYYKVGDCIMPKQGIFTRVIKGGRLNVGDKIEIIVSE